MSSTRPRGFASWRPQKKTMALLAQVNAVLDEYRAYLPLTVRQVFYRLFGAANYEKTENACARLYETANRARRAGYLHKEAGDEGDDETAGVMALRDLMAVFEEDAGDRIQSSVLVSSLNEMPDRPWPEWRRGKSMTANSLAKLLKPFGVRPRDLRFGTKNMKGYARAPVEAAFQRYCQAPPVQTATPRQSNEIKSLSPVQTATRTADVADCNGIKPLKTNNCRGVAVETADIGAQAALKEAMADFEAAADPFNPDAWS